MIQAEFPAIEFFYAEDVWNDLLWSRRLDKLVRKQLTPYQSAVLYGGRDGFIERYKGELPATTLESDHQFSGEQIRREIADGLPPDSSDGRRGVVWAAWNRFPTSYTAVDICAFRKGDDGWQVLLGRKHNETKDRMIGGFVEPDKGKTFTIQALRELREEAFDGEVTWPQLVPESRDSDRVVPDWRYLHEVDCIMTQLYVCEVLYGSARPGDDIAEVSWHNLDKINYEQIMPNHRKLLKEAVNHWKETHDA
jgi:bifunctional NMN adenylyltransferase/nudix hydrolase